jgi:hypothetical protein
VHFDSEAGEHSLGHKIIVVTQDQVFPVIPGVFGLVRREELGGDVGAATVGDFVAEFKPHHQLQQFMVHVAILIVRPNFAKILVGEAAEGLLDFFGVKDSVDSGGTPFGLEDDTVSQDFVILEVEADTEIVKVAAELEFVFAALEAVGITEGEEFVLGDVIAVIGF